MLRPALAGTRISRARGRCVDLRAAKLLTAGIPEHALGDEQAADQRGQSGEQEIRRLHKTHLSRGQRRRCSWLLVTRARHGRAASSGVVPGRQSRRGV